LTYQNAETSSGFFKYNTHTMKPLTDIDIEQIILMAWGDTIPFETIQLEYGLTENQVRTLMRKHQSEKTYIRWRERVHRRSGVNSKHGQLSSKTSAKQKF
jgi:uncharacterized protein (TIGR03643 family)